jgi:hypothetical protein
MNSKLTDNFMNNIFDRFFYYIKQIHARSRINI